MICDKCGKEVPKDNSVFEYQILIMMPAIGADGDRHLYPVDGCEGSPSRVQIIETKYGSYQEFLKQAQEEITDYIKVRKALS